jgi:serralysin
VLSFKTPPDFEAPTDAGGDNIYNIIVQASDGGLTSTQVITVTVTALNDEVLEFTSPPEFSVVQGSLAVGTLTAVDADVPGETVTFSIIGGPDQSKYILTTGGFLTFAMPPSFSMPTDADGDNVYVVEVQASGADQTAVQTISVMVLAAPLDYGDAPDTASGTSTGNYRTLASDNGPRHFIRGGLRLGTAIDGDSGMLQNAAATADDVNGALPDDEDGVVNPAADLWVTAGTPATVTLRATNLTGVAATLWGWIDYNADGTFDNATERTSIAVPTGTNNGLVTLVFPLVLGSFTGETFARFRLSSDADASDPMGEVGDGEVEDYPATITRPSNGQADPARNKKIASGTSGGPVLANGDMFGSSTAAIGDLDGDGVPDLVVGAPVQSGGSSGGKAYVLFMNANGTVKASQEIADGIGGGPSLMLGDYFGHSVASIGDLDGDGIGDIAVGADKDDTGGYNRGAVHVLFMNVNGTVKASTKIANGTLGVPLLVNGDRFGSSLASLGDLDGDGVADLAVGATGDGPYSGAVHVLFMRANGTVKSSTRIASGVNGGPTHADFDEFGIGTASLGDLDGDGITELAVGAFRDDTGGLGRGAVYVLFMNANGTVKMSTKIASGTGGGPTLGDGDYFGRSVASLGDLDGDGIGDLAVGAYRDESVGTSRGAVHLLFLNANGTVKRSEKIAQGSGGGPNLANDDRFGSALSAIGDLDGDGVIELAAGAETDRTGGIGRGAVHVLFLNAANSDPVITSPAAVSVPENTTTVHTITATDADFPPQTVTFTIVGGADQAKFTLASGGALSFVTPPNFEAPTDSDANNVYVVTVQANDGNGGTATQTIGVIVTPVNEHAPLITSADMSNVAENTTAVLTVTATDADVPPQPVTFSIAGGADQAKFAITPSGALTFIAPPNFEAPTDANGDNVYVVIVQASDGGLASVQAILVTVTPVNDNSPVFTSPTNFSVPENTTAIATVTATDADLPAQTVTFSLVGGADQARFAITSGGAFSFVAGRDFEIPTDADGNNVYVVTVQASDGHGGTTSQTINVTVTPVNDNSPLFTSPDSVNVPENMTAVATVTATDADLPPQSVTISIVGGADQSKFSLSSSGALSFISPPDFETPTDANGDNVYVVIVQASDGALTTLQAILVTVTNVIEAVPGDYNGNGVVDAADYVLWRNGGPLQNDSTPGVQPGDYDVWRANFGRIAAGSGASVADVEELATDVASQTSEAVTTRDSATVEPKPEKVESSSQLAGERVQKASLRITGFRTARRATLPSGTTNDNALIAWLTSWPAKMDRGSLTAFDDSLIESSPSENSDQSADALDLAFATL